MSSTTVAEFASELKKTNETLLEQLKAAGVAKSTATDTLTESDKQNLLSYLQASHGNAGGERKKITLVKKSTTEIKQADSTGKARTIQVEVRKKRTFVRREEGVDVPVVEASPSTQESDAAAALETAELARREEEASRQAELIRRQEEELAESRRLREEQEAKSRAAAEQAAKMAAEAEAAEEAAKKLAEKAKSAAAIASKTNEAVPATAAAPEAA